MRGPVVEMVGGGELAPSGDCAGAERPSARVQITGAKSWCVLMSPLDLVLGAIRCMGLDPSERPDRELGTQFGPGYFEPRSRHVRFPHSLPSPTMKGRDMP